MIKLRAWHKGQMKYDIDIIHYDKMEGGLQGFSENGFEYAKEDITWMRFTGLHDKNGKEIWEGDILASKKWNKVKKSEAPSVVFWMDTHAEFQHKWNEGNPFHPEKDFWNNEPLWKVACSMFQEQLVVEVIGNIYENPELIKSL